MFSDERASLGALDETDDTDEERRPWEFDLARSTRASPAGRRLDTGPRSRSPNRSKSSALPARRTGRPPDQASRHRDRADVHRRSYRGRRRPPIVAAAELRPRRRIWRTAGGSDSPGSPAGEAAEAAEAADDAVRPSGNPRVGRARRSGLLPARLKAKPPRRCRRPSAEPLAAEPPGASVADVPGAGRRKPGWPDWPPPTAPPNRSRATEAADGPPRCRPSTRHRTAADPAGELRRPGRRRAAAAVEQQLHAGGDRGRPAGPGEPARAMRREDGRWQHRPPGRHRHRRGRRRTAAPSSSAPSPR